MGNPIEARMAELMDVVKPHVDWLICVLYFLDEIDPHVFHVGEGAVEEIAKIQNDPRAVDVDDAHIVSVGGYGPSNLRQGMANLMRNVLPLGCEPDSEAWHASAVVVRYSYQGEVYCAGDFSLQHFFMEGVNQTPHVEDMKQAAPRAEPTLDDMIANVGSAFLEQLDAMSTAGGINYLADVAKSFGCEQGDLREELLDGGIIVDVRELEVGANLAFKGRSVSAIGDCERSLDMQCSQVGEQLAHKVFQLIGGDWFDQLPAEDADVVDTDKADEGDPFPYDQEHEDNIRYADRYEKDQYERDHEDGLYYDYDE